MDLVPPAKTNALTARQLKDIEDAIVSGCDEREACAYADAYVRDWQAHLAKAVGGDPNYLLDLQAKAHVITGSLKRYRKRVADSAQTLLDRQMSLANGQQFLYVVRTVDGKRQKPERVTDEETIRAYLEGELKDPDEWHYITTKEPDGQAIKEMMDRTYGKATERVDHTTKGESINDIAKLDDGQLDQLIASVQRAVGGTAHRKAPEDSGEPAQVRETPSEAGGVQQDR